MMPSNKDPGLLVCGVSYNMPQVWKNLTNKIEKDPSNVNGTVAVTLKPIWQNNINKIFHGHPINSFVVVPVIRDNTFIANIEIISDSDKIFQESDVNNLISRSHELAEILKR